MWAKQLALAYPAPPWLMMKCHRELPLVTGQTHMVLQEAYTEKVEVTGRDPVIWAWELVTPLLLDRLSPSPRVSCLPSPPYGQIPKHGSRLCRLLAVPNSVLFHLLYHCGIIACHVVSQQGSPASTPARHGHMTKFWPIGCEQR